MTGHPWQWFGGLTFSQHGEDLMLLSIFHRLGPEKPSYLDIGCQDPFVISNTVLLYMRGSHGINVDIEPDAIARFDRHRPHDKNIVAAVGPERSRRTFYIQGWRSSFVRELVEPYGIERETEVDVITLDDIIRQHAGGTFPDLLSIDIEGYDVPVLASFDFTKTHPRVIVAEGYCDNHDYHRELLDVLTKARFFFYAWAGSNMIFIHEQFRPAIFF